MKKSMMLAALGLLLMGGMTRAFAQDDSAKVAEEPKDTISIDNMDPVAAPYEDEPQKSSNGLTYAIIGGVLVIGGGTFYYIRRKKQ